MKACERWTVERRERGSGRRRIRPVPKPVKPSPRGRPSNPRRTLSQTTRPPTPGQPGQFLYTFLAFLGRKKRTRPPQKSPFSRQATPYVIQLARNPLPAQFPLSEICVQLKHLRRRAFLARPATGHYARKWEHQNPSEGSSRRICIRPAVCLSHRRDTSSFSLAFESAPHLSFRTTRFFNRQPGSAAGFVMSRSPLPKRTPAVHMQRLSDCEQPNLERCSQAMRRSQGGYESSERGSNVSPVFHAFPRSSSRKSPATSTQRATRRGLRHTAFKGNSLARPSCRHKVCPL
jgi:hypothetical protein